jgi:hypothetical protein
VGTNSVSQYDQQGPAPLAACVATWAMHNTLLMRTIFILRKTPQKAAVLMLSAPPRSAKCTSPKHPKVSTMWRTTHAGERQQASKSAPQLCPTPQAPTPACPPAPPRQDCLQNQALPPCYRRVSHVQHRSMAWKTQKNRPGQTPGVQNTPWGRQTRQVQHTAQGLQPLKHSSDHMLNGSSHWLAIKAPPSPERMATEVR